MYVKRMVTKTGTTTAVGEANVYDFLEQARLVEPKHSLARYGSPEPQSQARGALNDLYLVFIVPDAGVPLNLTKLYQLLLQTVFNRRHKPPSSPKNRV